MEEAKNNKDALLVQAVFALSQGCAGKQISEDACAWFHQRYYAWIDTVKADPKAGGLSPQQVWKERGDDFQGQFRKIGELAAKESGGRIEADTLTRSALAVESDSPCPYCP